MSLKEKLLVQFKGQLIYFIDELIEQFPEESDFIIMRILIKDQMNIEDIIEKFIADILPNKQDIKDRKNSLIDLYFFIIARAVAELTLGICDNIISPILSIVMLFFL